jgi:hypothetical protein
MSAHRCDGAAEACELCRQLKRHGRAAHPPVWKQDHPGAIAPRLHWSAGKQTHMKITNSYLLLPRFNSPAKI